MKAGLTYVMVAGKGAPVQACLTWPRNGIGRWTSQNVPGQTLVASVTADV